jgi:hypothetical protein
MIGILARVLVGAVLWAWVATNCPLWKLAVVVDDLAMLVDRPACLHRAIFRSNSPQDPVQAR